MKKLLPLLLMTALLMTVCASAEELMPNTYTNIDLDGDGSLESIYWTTVPVDEYVDQTVLTVEGADGTTCTRDFGDLFNSMMYIDDNDQDGIAEILVSGDVMSDDYYTYALRYEQGQLEQIPFADNERGGSGEGYLEAGYGYVSDLGNGIVELCGSQDFFGTYFATRQFALNGETYEFADDGFYYVDWDTEDPEVWEYFALNTLVELPCTLYEGDNAVNGTLPAGTHMLLTACDRVAEAYFLTEDGRILSLPIEFNEDDGYGYKVYGQAEYDVFDNMHYAD